jgi:hypothetical protein
MSKRNLSLVERVEKEFGIKLAPDDPEMISDYLQQMRCDALTTEIREMAAKMQTAREPLTTQEIRGLANEVVRQVDHYLKHRIVAFDKERTLWTAGWIAGAGVLLFLLGRLSHGWF